MNGVLSSWKAEGTFSPDKIENSVHVPAARREKLVDRAVIERHYAALRQIAEDRAEKIQRKALADEQYGKLHKEINSLNIKLAFAESRADGSDGKIAEQIAAAEKRADERLHALGINKDDFIPRYSCKICGDTGYDADGKPCRCLKKFIEQYKTT